jgi:hypothetical protein
MEYEKQELEDLLALEKPKKKKDISQVECHECKRLGHYSWDCPDKEKCKENEKKGLCNQWRAKEGSCSRYLFQPSRVWALCYKLSRKV